MPNNRILLLHWGQTGAGPRLQLELAKALIDEIGGDRLALSFNSESMLANELSGLSLPSHKVITYSRTTKSFLLNAPRILPIRRSLRSFVKEQRIESVYSVMDSPYQNLAAVPIRRNPFRYVATVHDAVPHAGDHALLGNSMLNLTLRSADQIITLSRHVKAQLTQYHHVEPARITSLFHPAWEGSPRSPRLLPVHGETVRIGFFGRLLPYKGVHLLLDALRQLRAEGYMVEGVIYGNGPEGRLAPEYRDVVPNWTPGWIDDNDIPSLLANIDLLVLPYLEASQSGVMAYALTAGLPVVGTPTGGLAEQIHESESGLVTEGFTGDSVAEAIRTILDDAELYARFSQNAIRAGAESFSWRMFAERLLPVLEG